MHAGWTGEWLGFYYSHYKLREELKGSSNVFLPLKCMGGCHIWLPVEVPRSQDSLP